MGNICRFVPLKQGIDDLRTVNFVYETDVPDDGRMKVQTTYIMHLVARGESRITVQGRTLPVKAGDLFLTFPGVPFRIEGSEGFEYYYISFIGTRAVRIVNELNLHHENPVMPSYGFLEDAWRHALEISTLHNLSLASESALLLTLSEISARTYVENDRTPIDAVAQMQRYIDSNFSDPELSMKALCERFSYNPKYGSALLKKHLNSGFRGYLNTVRIQNACALIKQGFTSVKDIAALCGYTDQAYFTKVFTKMTGSPPSRWLETQNR